MRVHIAAIPGGPFSARYPQLPGCEAHGHTIEEAVAKLADVREAYVSRMLADGMKEALRGLVIQNDATDMCRCLLCSRWWMILDYEDHTPDCPAQPGDDE